MKGRRILTATVSAVKKRVTFPAIVPRKELLQKVVVMVVGVARVVARARVGPLIPTR